MSEPIVLKITFIPVAPYKNRITGNRVRVSLDYWESPFFFKGLRCGGWEEGERTDSIVTQINLVYLIKEFSVSLR